MKAAAKFHAAIFHNASAPPFRSIGGRQFLQTQHAMRDAVHRFVGNLGGQIVEHHHGRAELREIVFDRQDLPAVA